MNSIIIIESNTSGTGELFLKRVINYGYTPIFLSANLDLYPFLDQLEIKTYEVDTTNIEGMINICKHLQENGVFIKGIFSSSEYYIFMAAKLAQEFGMPSANANAIAVCRNKYLQNNILREANLNIPKTYLIDNIDILELHKDNLKFPMIVKPVEGSGSVGVKKCDNYKSLNEHCSQLLGRYTNERGATIDNRVLLEEFIVGEEFSAELFNGKLIGVTKKYLSPMPFFIEIGHDYPAKLDKAILQTIENDVCEAVRTLNLLWGACHVEFRLMQNKLYFIEVNPRLAGDLIPLLVKYSQGIDLIDNQFRLITDMPLLLYKTCNKRAAIRFFFSETEGEIQKFNIEILKHEEGVLELELYNKVGGMVKKSGDFRERLGHVVFDPDILPSYKAETLMKEALIVGAV